MTPLARLLFELSTSTLRTNRLPPFCDALLSLLVPRPLVSSMI
jgi:hypothetical protein